MNLDCILTNRSEWVMVLKGQDLILKKTDLINDKT